MTTVFLACLESPYMIFDKFVNFRLFDFGIFLVENLIIVIFYKTRQVFTCNLKIDNILISHACKISDICDVRGVHM